MIYPEQILSSDWGSGVDPRDVAAAVKIIQAGIRPRFVYFVAARSYEEETLPSLVKIGTTTNPDRRLKEISASRGPDWLSDSDNLDSLGYMGFLLGDEQLERRLHQAFAAHRVAGEWFWLDPIDDSVDFLLNNFCVCARCLATDNLFQEDQ
jgi:hypothetical protein